MADAIPRSGGDGEAQLGASAGGPGQAHGLMDELEAQRRQRLEDVGEGVLEGAGPTCRAGIDLEAPDEIERQRAQQLAGGVCGALVGEGSPRRSRGGRAGGFFRRYWDVASATDFRGIGA